MQLSLMIAALVLISTISCNVPQDENVEVVVKTSQPPQVPADSYYFLETFDSANVIGSKWLKSKAKKDDVDEQIAKYDGEWSVESPLKTVEPSSKEESSDFDENQFEQTLKDKKSSSSAYNDLGLVLKSKAKHHAISARLSNLKPIFDFKTAFKTKSPLVVQYEVKFQNGLDCGGAYVKLLASSDQKRQSLEEFYDKTGFSIMFGPDKCGNDNKFHFIIRYKNPVTGVIEEKHAKNTKIPENVFTDTKTHLYTLILKPETNRYEMYVDLELKNSGSLLEDLEPSINPAKEIVDPEDKKPESWDEREKIEDPDAQKPDDWDESQPKMIDDVTDFQPTDWLVDEQPTVQDPEAVKPADWDEDQDGEWEAPLVDNPKCAKVSGCGPWKPKQVENPLYKGKWRAPLIQNPDYQGKWEPRMIPNPGYFLDENPFESLLPFDALGLELWSMSDFILFDNFLITSDEQLALDTFGRGVWQIKKDLETASGGSSSSSSVVEYVQKIFESLIKEANNDKPWLWAVYLIVVLIPIVLFVFCCCGGSKQETKRTTDTKKTDAVTKDDEPEEQDEEQEGGEEEAGEEEQQEEQVDMTESQYTKKDLEKSTTSIDPSPKQGTSPTKRRARKE